MKIGHWIDLGRVHEKFKGSNGSNGRWKRRRPFFGWTNLGASRDLIVVWFKRTGTKLTAIPVVGIANPFSEIRFSRASSFLYFAICIMSCLSLTGCIAVHWRDGNGIIQHRGALHYSLIDTDSARIFVQSTVGFDIRLSSYDPGISLGYRKYIAVQPKPKGFPISEESGYFWVGDAVTDRAGLYFKKVYGAELGFNMISNGLTVGYGRMTVIVGPNANESVTSKIEFSADNLSDTRFHQDKGGPE